ncbi:MAG: ABC transporter permease [Microvirga sp.]|nr:ABC transporter permease [Microvirga sp.]
MILFLVRRLIEAAAVLVGISVIVFLLLRMSGDPAAMMLPLEASQEEYELLRREMGLDRSYLIQYLAFAGEILRADFGMSIRSYVPALDLVLERMPATLLLTTSALVVALVIAIPAGILAGLNKDTAIDRIVMAFSVIGQGMPVFWLSLLLILLFAVNLRILPTSGYGTWQHLVMPSISLGLYTAARLARLVRSGVIEVASQDFVRTGYAKGLSDSVVVSRYVLRNALLPIVTVLGLDFASLIGGAVITETIFSWPGAGRLTVEAIARRDYPVVQAAVMLLAAVYVVVALLVDIAYRLIDPRIRLS